MSSFLVEEKIFPVKKEVCKDINTLAAIDRGCSLTKVLYVTEKDDEHYNLHFSLFKNAHFKEGLHYLKEKAILKTKDGKLHVTGAGCQMYKEDIMSILNLEIEFIDEFMSQILGSKWLLDNFDDEVICYPASEVDVSDLIDMKRSKTFEKMIKSFQEKAKVNSDGGKFPAIFCFVGSGGGAFTLQADGSSDIVGGIWLAGKSFLGLGKLLVGTNDYDEIMELASKGSRGNVDTQVKEVLDSDPNSPYGRFPPELPIFCFGKSVDQDRPLSDFNREDVAHSLVAGVCMNVFNIIGGAMKAYGIQNIYLGGNFFRHEITRKELNRVQAVFGGGKAMSKIQFVQTGHTGALGAMVGSQEAYNHFLNKQFGAKDNQEDNDEKK